ncbi:cyclic peptide export ABC transporter [Dyella sp.]|uniref:cyclic peptide export ABC transporter n=1 Tax=Dyella sp. TaxID=1869338 RepID=UPI002B459EE5|nr:cyclic peptide export ABC transporter [Dyella sp.]HKT30636.1 cyclic peptide export ABC transporter [Dyella sp.]
MDLLKLFTDRSPNKVFLSLFLGALAGFSYALLIPVVLASLADVSGGEAPAGLKAHFLSLEISNYRFGILFCAICLLILFCRATSQILLTRVALDATTDLRVKTYRQIAAAPIAELEKVGSSKLLVAITTDVARIISGAISIPNVLVSIVTVTGMLSYLYLLSSDVFAFVIKAILFGVVTYQVPMLIGNKYFARGRAEFDMLQESIRGLIYGAKELKLNKIKRDRYFDEFLATHERSVLRNTKRANTIVVSAANYGDLLSFYVIGVIAYIFVSYHSIESVKLVGAMMALIYIASPVALILNSLPQIINARVSLRSVKKLFDQIPVENVSESAEPLPPWETVRLAGVTFHYSNEGSEFALGPIDLEISKGEVTFIVGGNGSGKSTLSKIISLHYHPSSGDIFFGDTKIDASSMGQGRACMAAIFTDYYLFDRLLGSLDTVDQRIVESYLSKLGIANKVRITDGHFSTTSLSDGQRKRVALLVALIEDRDIYLFDEWAADQDPSFKEVFYHQVLPELKAKNKVVVVISHDDRYFHVADKLLVMEDGKLIRTELKQPDPLQWRANESGVAV